MGNDGLAQITLQHPADVAAVLHDHRLIQSVFGQQSGVACGVYSALAGQGLNRVTRDQSDQKKRQQRHAEKSRNDQTQSGQCKAEHGSNLAVGCQ